MTTTQVMKIVNDVFERTSHNDQNAPITLKQAKELFEHILVAYHTELSKSVGNMAAGSILKSGRGY